MTKVWLVELVEDGVRSPVLYTASLEAAVERMQAGHTHLEWEEAGRTVHAGGVTQHWTASFPPTEGTRHWSYTFLFEITEHEVIGDPDG